MTASLRLVTVTAIHGFVASWFKWNLCLITTTGTDNDVHLARFTFAVIPTAAPTAIVSTTRLLACSPAVWTTTRGIRQSAARIKFLLTNAEGEFCIAIATIQGLI